jgi:hypothetical protein
MRYNIFLKQVFDNDPAIIEIITGNFDRDALIKLSALIEKKIPGPEVISSNHSSCNKVVP